MHSFRNLYAKTVSGRTVSYTFALLFRLSNSATYCPINICGSLHKHYKLHMQAEIYLSNITYLFQQVICPHYLYHLAHLLLLLQLLP